MAETIVMDPTEEATGRTQLDITRFIRWEGIDWGDAAIAGYMADMTYGSSPVDYRVPNRTVTIPLSLRTIGSTGFESIRGSIQAKIATWQQEGGWLRRISSDGGTLYADVVNAAITLGGGYGQAVRDYDVDAQLTLECLPDFYGKEATLSDHTETSAAELIFTDTGVTGNYPARVRMVVDNDQASSQLGLVWGFRSRNYSSASTAALAYEAEALHPLDTATKVALSGASGGTVVTHGTLSTAWTPVLATTIGGTATYMTHVGNYRWWARYRTTSGTAVALRGLYDVGDLVNPVDNDPWRHPAGTGGTAFYIADLGELRLNAAPVGTHRWTGMIQARGMVGTENVSVDRVWFQPLDESAGVLRASASADPGVAAFSARSEFNTESGALAGDSAAVGGAWAGTGDADDFTVASGVATRTATTDTFTYNGRYALSGVSAMTAQAVQADFALSEYSGTSDANYLGVLARATDSNNWVMAVFVPDSETGGQLRVQLVLKKRAGGTIAEFGRLDVPNLTASAFYTIRLAIDTSGNWWVWCGRQGAALTIVATGHDTVFATGGTLASGKPGFYDANTTATAVTRTVDNFLAWVPQIDAVLSPSQSAELRWDGIYREDSTGTAYGPVSHIEGDLPRLPVSGLEGRTVQTFVKASRGDLDQLPDTGIDDLSCRLTYRPCWLTVPG